MKRSHHNLLVGIVRRVVAGALCLVALACAPAAPRAATAPAPLPATAPSAPAGPTDPRALLDRPLTAAEQRWVDSTLASLTLRERIAQMVMVWVLGDYTSTGDSSFEAASERVTVDRVGGVVMSLGSPIEVAAKVNALQRLARVPLLVASDVEPGLGRLEGGTFTPGLLQGGSATVLPSQMAIGATGKAHHARTAGRITGEESRAIGIHLAFAPTVDVNNNPANPVINVRSFGEDPAAVSRLAGAFVAGVQGAGVAATVKHFPGHGDTDTDSHLALPIVSANRVRLDSLELRPFRATFGEGAAAVMSAHIALPAVAGDSTPATLVPAIMGSLLRDSLGFRGLAVTDAMDMRGVGQGYGVEESSVRAVQAGSDILLMPADVPAAISSIAAAVERGAIEPSRIDASARRILELKVRTDAVRRPIVPLDSLRMVVGSAAHRREAQRIADDAVTLLRNDERQVPMVGNAPTLVLTFAAENDLGAGRTFAAEVRKAMPRARFARINVSTPRARLDSLVREGERVVLATFVRTIEGEGRFSVGAHVARWVDSLAAQRAVTVVAFSNPYVLREFPQVSGYIAAYGRGEALERAAARSLTGAQPFRGRAPISLPGLFRMGSGIVTPADSGNRGDREGMLPPAAARDSLQVLLDRGVRDSVFPGGIALIGDRRGILAMARAGRIDWAPDAPAPDSATLWDLASLTKVVGLTTGVMQLVEQGRLSLDAPVQRYLPEWQGRYKDRVTLRNLLTHTAGLRPVPRSEQELPDAALQRKVFLDATIDTIPGVRYVYSDIGPVLAGFVVERVTGESLDAFLARSVFTPLGMVDTRFNPPAAWLGRIAPTEIDPKRGHIRGEVHDPRAWLLGGVAGHAGLFGSARDLARFARMMLSGGALDGARILSAETIRDYTRRQNAVLSHRDLGWESPEGTNSAGTLLSRRAFGHTGFTGTSIWMDPELDRFVILLTNRVNPTSANSRIAPYRRWMAELAACTGNPGPYIPD